MLSNTPLHILQLRKVTGKDTGQGVHVETAIQVTALLQYFCDVFKSILIEDAALEKRKTHYVNCVMTKLTGPALEYK